MFSDFFHNLGITDAFTWLAEQISTAELWQQLALLLLAGGIPFIESYLGSFLGVLFGVSPALAIPAAIAGNLIVTLGLVLLSARTREAARARTASRAGARSGVSADTHDGRIGADVAPAETSRSRKKIRRAFDRFGVPGVCLLGPIVLASQITAPALIAMGAPRRSVLIWQTVAVIAWGLAFGLFGEWIVEQFAIGA